MPIYLNSTKVGSNAYDVHSNVSTKLNKIKMDNTLVWQGLPEWYTAVRDNNIVTESQWLDFLDNNGIIYAKNRNEQNLFIGTDKKITIANSQTPDYSYWNIADFDHDGVSDTCDLIQCNTVYKYSPFGSNNYYNGSNVRSWLIGTYYNGFSANIINKLVTMHVTSNGSILDDKVKLLSAKEVGVTPSGAPAEGNPYSIFTDYNSRIRSGTYDRWWLRTRTTQNTNYIFCVNTDGSVTTGTGYYSNPSGVVTCIRFS